VRFIPRRAAAPSASPTCPLHAENTRMISARCFLAISYASAVRSNCGLHRKCVFTGSDIATTPSRNISTSRSLNPAASRCSASEKFKFVGTSKQ